MKLTRKIYSLLLLLPLVAMACVRQPDAPQIEEPRYDGTDNITIRELRQEYGSINEATEIASDYVLRGTVIGNDESGNIYKQLYIRDKEGNAINVGVEQNSVYSFYQVGQEVFIELHNLAMVKYGGELQIGMLGTNANRIEWNRFREVAHRNGFPDPENAQPVERTIATLTDADLNNLVRIDNVYFQNHGTGQFAPGTVTNEENLVDLNDQTKTLVTRNSNYSDFAKQYLPDGSGSVTGILGRYNGNWQLFFRTAADYSGMTGPLPGEGPGPGPGGDDIFVETFGTGNLTSAERKKIGDYTGFDNGSPISFSDATGRSDIRTTGTSTDRHVWFPSSTSTNPEASLRITGINTSGQSDIVLTFDLAANVFSAGETMNLNAMKVSINGQDFPVPSREVSGPGDANKFYPVEITGVPSATDLTIEFKTESGNTKGMRLDNVKLTADGGGTTPIPPDPQPGGSVYRETFGTGTIQSSARPKIGVYTEFDNSSPIVYSDDTGRSDIRTVSNSTDRHVWLPAANASNPESALRIAGVNTEGKSGLKLTFDLAANVFSAGETMNFNALKLSINGQDFPVPSRVVSGPDDANKFYPVEITGVPAAASLTIEFRTGAENTKGFRLDNVEITAAS